MQEVFKKLTLGSPQTINHNVPQSLTKYDGCFIGKEFAAISLKIKADIFWEVKSQPKLSLSALLKKLIEMNVNSLQDETQMHNVFI